MVLFRLNSAPSVSLHFTRVATKKIPRMPPIEDIAIPEAVISNMQHNPQVPPFYTYYTSNEVEELHVITHLEFGQAHRAAGALFPNAKGHDGQVVAIIALVDSMLYQTILTGLIIAGFIVHTSMISFFSDFLGRIQSSQRYDQDSLGNRPDACSFP